MMHKTTVLGKLQEIRKKQDTPRERIQNNEMKEDFLIKQIDEFKEKAQQLQELLDTKESRVQELQSIVDEREEKAKNLEEILQEKQQEADNITKGVEGYAKQVGQELGNEIGKLKDYFDERQQKEEDTYGQFSGLVTGLSEKIDAVKNELSEKVHTENVKCYRNMQTLIEEVEEELKSVELGRRSMKSIKGYLKFAIALGIINMLAMVFLVLCECGVFDYIF